MPEHRHGLAPYTPEARERTPGEQTKRLDLCRTQEQAVERAVHHGREALWDLARALYEFDSEQGFAPLGYDRLDDWLAARSDLGIGKDTYYRLVRAWRTLAVVREVPVAMLQLLDPSKVDIARTALESGRASVDEVLEAVGSMTARQLREWASEDQPAQSEAPLNATSKPHVTSKPDLDATSDTPIVASEVQPPGDGIERDQQQHTERHERDPDEPETETEIVEPEQPSSSRLIVDDELHRALALADEALRTYERMPDALARLRDTVRIRIREQEAGVV